MTNTFENIITVGVGDFAIGKSPNMIRTNLGSCIGICLFSPLRKVGGLFHALLPDSSCNRSSQELQPKKYVDTGFQLLFESLKQEFFVEKSLLQAKIFGGASVIRSSTVSVGQDNIKATHSILKEYNIPIIAEKTGGTKGYAIDFKLDTGTIICRQFGEKEVEL